MIGTGFSLFNLEDKALSLCEARASLLAKNMANANTPGYKSQDINFHEALVQSKHVASLDTSHAGHIGLVSMEKNAHLYYRIPMQYTADGNTVDDEIERKDFLENSIKYQASLGFVEKKAAELIKAIRGE